VATNHGVGGSNPSSPTTGPKGKDLSFTSGGKKIMIGIADAKLWNLGMVFCRNGMALPFLFIYFIGKPPFFFIFTYSNPAGVSIFMFYSP
jgi:hypothetical protein